MTLTENRIQTQVTVQQPGPTILVQWADVISRDGEEISRQYRRKAYAEWQYDEFFAEVENAAAYIAAAGWVPGKLPPAE